MNKDSALLRGLMIVGLCLPVALILGYQLATPDQLPSLIWIGAMLAFFALPFLIRWHHPLLIVCWNLPMVAFFLPGSPQLGLVVAGISLFISVISWVLQKQKTLIHCPAISYPLILFTVVVLVTMKATGGIGGRILGSQISGLKHYFYILAPIMGYFALTAQPIASKKVKFLAALFFLSGTVAIIPAMASIFGLNLPYLGVIFTSAAMHFSDSTSSLENLSPLNRFASLSILGTALYSYMMMRFGIRGIFDWHRPWRLMCFGGFIFIGMFGVYRSFILVFFIIFIIQFFLEKLHRTHLFWGMLAGTLLAGTVVVSFADRMPLPVQRCLAFLPIKIDQAARYSANAALDWRLDMWRELLPEVPKYFFFGKGYDFDAADLYLTNIGIERGLYNSFDWAMVTGDYHNGPLTIIIPFGIWGLLAFLAFIFGASYTLYINYRHGDQRLKHINIFLLSCFIAHASYFMINGMIGQDMVLFIGLAGFGVALNGVVKKTAVAPQPVLIQTPNGVTSKTQEFQPV